MKKDLFKKRAVDAIDKVLNKLFEDNPSTNYIRISCPRLLQKTNKLLLPLYKIHNTKMLGHLNRKERKYKLFKRVGMLNHQVTTEYLFLKK